MLVGDLRENNCFGDLLGLGLVAVVDRGLDLVLHPGQVGFQRTQLAPLATLLQLAAAQIKKVT